MEGPVVLLPPSLVLLVLPLDPVPLLEVPVHHLELEDAPFWRKMPVGVSTTGVPGPTSKLSPRVPAQMGQRETEHEGGNKRESGERGNPRPSCCPAPRSGALAVGGYKRPRGRGREACTCRPVLLRGQPSRKRALDLPFIGVRRGSRCTMGGVAVC